MIVIIDIQFSGKQMLIGDKETNFAASQFVVNSWDGPEEVLEQMSKGLKRLFDLLGKDRKIETMDLRIAWEEA